MSQQQINDVLNNILEAFETGNIPEAIAIASFPIPDIPSAKWSFMNRAIQYLHGTMDARGFNQWKSVKRQVCKGSKALYILVPCFKKVIDEATNEEKQVLYGFKSVPVFRVEDTDGEPLDYQQIELPELPLIERAYDWGIDVKAVPGNYRYYGSFSPGTKQISMATASEKTFFHELAHAGDFIIRGKLKLGQDPLQEITAELSAQALARIVGKNSEDTTGNSFRYIKGYAEAINLSPHKACLQVLSQCEKILNLILHGQVDGVNNYQKVA